VSPRATIVLAVTGSIAAYKAPFVLRGLRKEGFRVLPIMTRSATQFVGASTLAGLAGEPVRSDMWDPATSGELHVEIASAADVIAIVPATADTLSRLAQGRADDLLTATVLCARCPVLVAPAMHPAMWSHPATQRNVAILRADGVTFVGPEEGEVASGDSGVGRLAEPDAVVAAIMGLVSALGAGRGEP
jgi:phosphopantothenoylcysteine decarboxylase/phosphopantothenate--cysteine ligase